MGEDSNSIVGRWEKQGQQDLLNSDTLPIDGSKPKRGFLYNYDGENSRFETDDEWKAHEDEPQWAGLGFVFGDFVPERQGEAMFRYATLPEGWTRKGSDHDMWSYIVDERGRERVAVFFKAAFYDRSAHMYIVKMEGPVNGSVYNDHPFELDERYAADSEYKSCATCYKAERFRWHQPEFPFGDEVE
jgi:hypothetical protein